MTATQQAEGPPTCAKHNLRYDAVAGCLLCRREQLQAEQGQARRRVLRGVAAGVALLGVVAGAGLYLWSSQSPYEVGGEGISVDDGAFVSCVQDCAEIAERCDARCLANQTAGRCRATCLNGGHDCTRDCSRRHHTEADPFYYTYASGPLPGWESVNDALEAKRHQLALCSDYSAVNMIARIAGGPGAGEPADLVVASRGADEELEECFAEQLATLPLGESPEPYLFVFRLDPTESLAARALSSAELELAAARRDGDKDRIADAQQRAWAAREHARSVQREDEAARQRLHAEREAERRRLAAEAWQAEMADHRERKRDAPPTGSTSYHVQPDVPLIDNSLTGVSNSRSRSSYSSYDNDRVRAQRERARLDAEARKRYEVQKLDSRARREERQRQYRQQQMLRDHDRDYGRRDYGRRRYR